MGMNQNLKGFMSLLIGTIILLMFMSCVSASNITTIDFDTEGDYIQEDISLGTSFVNGTLLLQSGIPSDTYSEVQKVQSSIPTSNERFGKSVGIMSNDTILVGAQGYSIDNLKGKVYVFKTADEGITWTKVSEIFPSTYYDVDNFGFSLSVDGNRVIVGAPGTNSNEGAAYVFGLSWTQKQKLIASDHAGGDQFGYSVAIDNDLIIVGAYLEDTGFTHAGAAYFFKTTDGGNYWSQKQKVQATDKIQYQNFGYAVSIFDNTAIIGAPGDDDAGMGTGAAYVFYSSNSGDSWTQVSKARADDKDDQDVFGRSVALNNEQSSQCTFVVGAELEDARGTNSGSVYTFWSSYGSRSQKQKLSEGNSADYFGTSVAMYDNTLIVGAMASDAGVTNAGAAYIFKRPTPYSNFVSTQVITSSDIQGGDKFGKSVGTNDHVIIVGAEEEDTGGSNAGAAYIFIPGTGYATAQPYYVTTSDTSQKDTSGWIGINSISLTQTTPTDTDIKYLVSFDGRTTWKTWND